jgi:hypothetical protein
MKNRTVIIETVAFLLVLMVSTVFSQEARIVPKDMDSKNVEVIFNSIGFQSSIKTDKGLGALAQEHSTIGNKDTSFGFAAASDEARFFLIGSVYSEALAYLQGGKLDLAAERLKLIEKEFITLNVPSPLFNYINKTRNLIERDRYSKEALIDFMSLFQPFFEEYAKNKSEDKLTLFRAGSWLMDMSLATAAGNKELLKQTVKLNYFIKEMKRMDAPKGVLTDLDEMEKIANKTDITDKDTKKVLDLVKEIQTILG